VVVGERMFRRGFESGSAHGWDEKAGRRGGQQLSSIKDLSLYFRVANQTPLWTILSICGPF
jgi:hypothetical protein